MHRLSCRDPDALGLIFDLHASAMYGVLLNITGDRDVSDDLLQEAFLKVWTRASQFDAGKGKLRMWLISVVRNLALDYFRSAGYLLSRHRSADMLLERIPHIDEELKFYRSHWISAGLCSLPPHEKRVLELAYFLGYSHAEIAPLMHVPLGTVKTWTRSALTRLREEFSRDLMGKHSPLTHFYHWTPPSWRIISAHPLKISNVVPPGVAVPLVTRRRRCSKRFRSLFETHQCVVTAV